MKPSVAAPPVLLLLIACAEPAPPEVASSTPVPPPAPLETRLAADVTPAPVYTHDALGRDPFRSLYDGATEEEPTAEGVLPGFELDQLALVGIVVGTSRPLAMVEDPAGIGHALHVGMLLGRDRALVRSIGRDGVVLERRIRQPNGLWAPVLVAWNLEG